MTGESTPGGGQELVPAKQEDVVLEGEIVDGPFLGQGFAWLGPPVSYEAWSPPPPPRPRRGPSFASVLVDELTSTFVRFFADLRTTSEALADLGLLTEEPPADPRARALWLKQHRGHGPETPKNWRKR